MQDITIRNASLADAPRILEIYAWYVEHTVITFEYDVPSLEEFEGRMRRTMQKYPYLVIERDGRVEGDRSDVFAGLPKVRLTAHTPQLPEGSCRLDIFVDPNLIEIFINEGQYVLSHVVYDLGSQLEGRFDAIDTL